MNRDQAIALTREDLRGYPKIADACCRVIEYLLKEDERNLRHITYGTLSRVSGLVDQAEAAHMIRYLTGDRVALLDTKFEFVEGDLIEPIQAKELAMARSDGVFYHPHTGNLVQEYQKYIFVYFEPGFDVRAIRGDAG